MIKRDELSNPKGCLNQAADDEPIFVLRANDELAPSVVRHWADCYWYQKTHGPALGLTDAQRAKMEEACALAAQMEDWKRRHP